MSTAPPHKVLHDILDEYTSLSAEDLAPVEDNDEYWARLVDRHGTDDVAASLKAAMRQLNADKTRAQQALKASLDTVPPQERARQREEGNRAIAHLGWIIEALQHRSRFIRLVAKDERVRLAPGEAMTAHAALSLARAIRAHREVVEAAPSDAAAHLRSAHALWQVLDDPTLTMPHGRSLKPTPIAEVLRLGSEAVERRAAKRTLAAHHDDQPPLAPTSSRRANSTPQPPDEPPANRHTVAPPRTRTATARPVPIGDGRTPVFLPPDP